MREKEDGNGELEEWDGESNNIFPIFVKYGKISQIFHILQVLQVCKWDGDSNMGKISQRHKFYKFASSGDKWQDGDGWNFSVDTVPVSK